MAYPAQFRKKLLSITEKEGLTIEEGAKRFVVGKVSISRWKNMEQINDCGGRAASRYEGVSYWDYNWRKGGGASRMIEISKRENFYQQESFEEQEYEEQQEEQQLDEEPEQQQQQQQHHVIFE